MSPARAITEHGRASREAQELLARTGEALSPFKLVPRHQEGIVAMPRATLKQIRRHERAVMVLCVNEAKMPRADFLQEFLRSKTSMAWINRHIKAGHAYGDALKGAQGRDRARAQEAGRPSPWSPASRSARSRTSIAGCRSARRRPGARRRTWWKRTCGS